MDREPIITHLQIIRTWAEFAHKRDLQFFTKKHLEDIVQWSDDAIALLKEQPEIVRCRDCKYFYPEKMYMCPIHGTDFHPKGTDFHPKDRYWFCADGERR